MFGSTEFVHSWAFAVLAKGTSEERGFILFLKYYYELKLAPNMELITLLDFSTWFSFVLGNFILG